MVRIVISFSEFSKTLHLSKSYHQVKMFEGRLEFEGGGRDDQDLEVECREDLDLEGNSAPRKFVRSIR